MKVPYCQWILMEGYCIHDRENDRQNVFPLYCK